MIAADDAITVRDLTKRYAGKAACESINLSVRQGSTFGLLGPTAPARARSSACSWV